MNRSDIITFKVDDPLPFKVGDVIELTSLFLKRVCARKGVSNTGVYVGRVEWVDGLEFGFDVDRTHYHGADVAGYEVRFR